MWKRHKYTHPHRRRRSDLLKSLESSISAAYLTLDTFQPALASHSFWEALGSHFWQERERKRDTVLILLLSSLYKHLSLCLSASETKPHCLTPFPLLIRCLPPSSGTSGNPDYTGKKRGFFWCWCWLIRPRGVFSRTVMKMHAANSSSYLLSHVAVMY